METSSDSLSPVELLAEEFLNRQQRGESPTIEEYCRRHPDLAEEIRDVFEGFLLIEDLKPGSNDVSAALTGNRQLDGKKLDRVGDYRIVREVGRGGMGVVYEAEQESLRRRVALKVLPKQHSANAKSLQRFQREARAAARMHHTNIVPVFEVGQADEWDFYAMQLIQGQGLDLVIDDLRRIRTEHSLLKSKTNVKTNASHAAEPAARSIAASLIDGKFQQEDLVAAEAGSSSIVPSQVATSDSEALRAYAETMVQDGGSAVSAVLPGQSEISSAETDRHGYFQSVAQIGLQTARALSYAHARGIIHRDIKPSNLLLDAAGIVWVTDFGLAKTSDEGMTHTGDILGTIRYMSPERFRGQCDNRGDVYSLGLTLYEMLVLKPAFSSPDRLRLIEMVTKTEPELPRSLDPKIPRDLETIVLKCVDKDPRRRYQSADELADDLQRFVDDEPIQARRVSLSERLVRWSRRNKGLAASLAMVCLLLLIFNIAGPMVTLHLRQLNQDLRQNEVDLKQQQAELQRAGEESRLRANEMEQLAVARDQGVQKAIAARNEAQRQKNVARRSEYISTLLAAQQAITSPGSYQRGKELLDGLRPPAGENDLRGIEFHLLNSLFDTSGEQIINRGLSGRHANISFSPDGRFLAGADNESNTVVVVDLDSGDILKRFSGHQDWVTQVEWKSNGTQLISSDNQESFRVWDVEREVELNSFRAGRVFALSPDESRVLIGTRNGRVQIFATDTGEVLKAFEGHAGPVHDVAWSIDGRFASCGEDGTVRLWDPGTQKSDLLIERNPNRTPVRWTCIKFSPDGSQLAVSSHQPGNESIVIWDMENHDRSTRLPVTWGMGFFNWSHDGTRLAGCSGNTVEIWEPATGKRVRRLTNHTRIQSVSWSPDDRRLASRGKNGVIYLCNVEQEVLPPEFVGHQNGVNQLIWSPDGQCFATGGIDGTVRIWDVRSKQELEVFDGHKSSVIWFLDWHPRQDRLVSCDQKGDALVWSWDGKHSRQVRRLEAQSNDSKIQNACWSPDGSQIAVAERRGFRGARIIRIIDADTFETLDEFSGDGTWSISWEQNSEGKSRVAVADQKQVTVWDPATGISEELLPKSLNRALFVSLNPQVDRVAVAGESNPGAFGDDVNTASLWIMDLQTKQELRLRGHDSFVTSIHWSKDGTRLLTSGEDGTCILWDPASGQQLVSFGAPDRDAVHTARFSPDELQIAFAGAFTGVRLLNATPSYEQQLSAKLLPELADRIRSAPTSKDLVLRGRIKAHQGNWDEAAQDFDRAAELTASGQPRALWFETAWWLAGPYPESLAERQPPEQHLDPQQPIPAADALGDPTTWDPMGISEELDLGTYLAGAEHVSAYAMKRIYAAERQTIGLLLGADDQVRVWCNGTLQHAREEARAAVSDDEAVEITLEAGWNDLLIKVANHTGAHGLFARLSRNPRELAEVFNRNQRWEQAFFWWERAAAIQSDDPDLFLAHGRAALRSGRRELAEDLFDKALQAGNGISVRRTIAEAYLDDALAQSEGAAESLDRSQQHYEQLLESEGNRNVDVEGLADVLLAKSALETGSTWTVLEPVAMESSGGATLTKLEDGSILASGVHPVCDSYELVMETSLTTITGVRLEAMTHESLPNRGPGRSSSTNGVAGVFALTTLNWEDEATHKAIRFDQIAADYSLPNPRTPLSVNFWHIYGGQGESHEAVYRVATPIRRSSGFRHRVKMQFNQIPAFPGLSLGRFRISVTDDATTFSREQRRLIAARISDPRLKLAEAYDLNGEPDLAAKTIDSLLEDLNRRIRAGTASPDIFQSRGELHVRRGRIEKAIEDFVSAKESGAEGVVDQVLRLSQDTHETVDVRIDLLNAALIHDPDHLGGLREKVKLDYGLKRLDEAADALKRIVELDPNDFWSIHCLGVLLIKTGDLDGYRQFRKSLIGRSQTIDHPAAAAGTAEICLLLPLADLDQNQVDALEKLSKFGNAGVGTPGEQWDQVRMGVLEYRRGHFDESYRWSNQSLSASDVVPAIAWAYCFGAMAQQQLGNKAEAQELLQKANHVITGDFPLLNEGGHSNHWNNYLMAEIAYDEAKRLIDPKE